MDIKKRLRNYGLWLSVFAFIPLLCEGFGWNVLPANYKDVIILPIYLENFHGIF